MRRHIEDQREYADWRQRDDPADENHHRFPYSIEEADKLVSQFLAYRPGGHRKQQRKNDKRQQCSIGRSANGIGRDEIFDPLNDSRKPFGFTDRTG